MFLLIILTLTFLFLSIGRVYGGAPQSRQVCDNKDDI